MMAAQGGGKSDMNGWTDGVPYSDITTYDNQYYERDGAVTNYNNWSRTGYIPCDGARYITFSEFPVPGTPDYNYFFTQAKQVISKFTLNGNGHGPTTVTVPANAYYFGISIQTASLNTFLQSGNMTPYR